MSGRRSRIESLSNPLVKRMRLLREKRHRRAEELFLAEGLRIATEAREARVLPRWLFLADEGAAAPPPPRPPVHAPPARRREVIDTPPPIPSHPPGPDHP